MRECWKAFGNLFIPISTKLLALTFIIFLLYLYFCEQWNECNLGVKIEINNNCICTKGQIFEDEAKNKYCIPENCEGIGNGKCLAGSLFSQIDNLTKCPICIIDCTIGMIIETDKECSCSDVKIFVDEKENKYCVPSNCQNLIDGMCPTDSFFIGINESSKCPICNGTCNVGVEILNPTECQCSNVEIFDNENGDKFCIPDKCEGIIDNKCPPNTHYIEIDNATKCPICNGTCNLGVEILDPTECQCSNVEIFDDENGDKFCIPDKCEGIIDNKCSPNTHYIAINNATKCPICNGTCDVGVEILDPTECQCSNVRIFEDEKEMIYCIPNTCKGLIDNKCPSGSKFNGMDNDSKCPICNIICKLGVEISKPEDCECSNVEIFENENSSIYCISNNCEGLIDNKCPSDSMFVKIDDIKLCPICQLKGKNSAIKISIYITLILIVILLLFTIIAIIAYHKQSKYQTVLRLDEPETLPTFIVEPENFEIIPD